MRGHDCRAQIRLVSCVRHFVGAVATSFPIHDTASGIASEPRGNSSATSAATLFNSRQVVWEFCTVGSLWLTSVDFPVGQ